MRKIAIREVDSDTGLEKHLAEKIKQQEQENQQLNEKIKNLGVAKTESGLELSPADTPTIQITVDNVIKPVEPNILKIGDVDSYVHNVVTANITIPSSIKGKKDVQEINFEETSLPLPKKYKRVEGIEREEIFFIAEETPEIFKVGDSIDLKAIVSYLAWKVAMLEQEVEKLKRKV
jgi:hypothetical protein